MAAVRTLDARVAWGVPAQVHSEGKNSIFKGKTLKGKEVHIVAGVRVKYRDGSLVD